MRREVRVGLAEGGANQRGLFFVVGVMRPHGRAGARGPSDAAQRDTVGKRPGELWGGEGPGSHVGWLFLNPDDLSRIRITSENVGDRIHRKWVQLLDSDDRDGLVGLASRACNQVDVDVTGTENDPAHGVTSVSRRIVINDRLEGSGGEITER